VLKAASARPAARPDALRAVIGASGGVETAARPAAVDTVGAARYTSVDRSRYVAAAVAAFAATGWSVAHGVVRGFAYRPGRCSPCLPSSSGSEAR
jgi:hypothetical protein